MRTTVRLPDDLHARAKTRAAASGMTFTELLEEALRMILRDDMAGSPRATYRVDPLPPGDGLRPGVDLTDAAGLLDTMEGR